MLATFRDGSGNQRDKDKLTYADWRQIERCLAEILDGEGGEDKNIFDVVSLDDKNSSIAYGFSIKSKALSKGDFENLKNDGRVYMEIANSPAKFWSEIKKLHGLTEESFRKKEGAKEIGDTVLQTVMRWHAEGKCYYDNNTSLGAAINLTASCYLCITSTNEKSINLRKYQVHSFPLKYPSGIKWKYKSASCLSGYDPDEPEKVLVDWYGVSGGQLKYYPKASSATYKSTVFDIPPAPKIMSIKEKVLNYFPDYKK